MLFRTVSFVALLLVCGVVIAADGGSAITDPKEAGPDFGIQGEYLGNFDLGDGIEQKFGLQVISLGDGRYRGVAYFGGLPGAGWDRFTKLQTESETTDDGTVKLVANEGYAVIKDGKVTVYTIDEQEIGALERIERESPTAGAEPPEGAIVLFDGSHADEWDGGTLTADGLLAGGCTSKRTFNDFTLHLEFRTPYMPAAKGQARGNSGVYLQDRYELQILDSFGLDGLDNECGGFYSKRAPSENLCFPPLAWQTYDIDFTAARYDDDGNKVSPAKVTVKHNGVVIHDNYELTGATPGRMDEGTGPGGIHLQDHGNPVVFRNIWIVEKAAE